MSSWRVKQVGLFAVLVCTVMGKTSRIVCRTGLYNEGQTSRIVCRIGLYNEGQTSRIVCRIGLYNEGQTSMIVCRIGLYNEGQTSRIVCRIGLYNEGQTSRIICRIGLYNESKTSRIVCRIGLYHFCMIVWYQEGKTNRAADCTGRGLYQDWDLPLPPRPSSMSRIPRPWVGERTFWSAATRSNRGTGRWACTAGVCSAGVGGNTCAGPMEDFTCRSLIYLPFYFELGIPCVVIVPADRGAVNARTTRSAALLSLTWITA